MMTEKEIEKERRKKFVMSHIYTASLVNIKMHIHWKNHIFFCQTSILSRAQSVNAV